MNRTKRPRALLLAMVLILGSLLLPVIGKAVAELAGIAQAAEQQDYIYFDLAAGNVKIGKDTYEGYIYVEGTATKVSGTHDNNNKYYIYQSNLTDESSAGYYTKTGYTTQADYEGKINFQVPTYNRVKNGNEMWTEYITNNTKVKDVSNAWKEAAEAVGREGTLNNITFAAGGTYDTILDNIWSTYHQPYTSRTTGGITAHLGTVQHTDIQLKLKGDNRFGNIHYHSHEGKDNQIVFSNGDSESNPGSVTVADFPDKWNYNHWCSAIGGNDDGSDKSDGIVINSGVIYAGTTPEDNCTAIGGGGNEYGRVTINDGIVTAVAATTGTAIGGGIGWGDKGGNADVTINKGEVYAYNFGVDNSSSDKFEHYVPAVAIGGGSSQNSRGNDRTTVTIKGGTVYAQCMGGAAIGGGGSASQTGGNATINISGGTIIAKSTTGKFQGTKDPDVVDISAGVSIGGGTGKTGGGSVTLNISGGTLRTGSIGGGKTTGTGTLGSATVTITGGDITGQVIMEGTGDENKKCSFTMTDGTLHNTNVIDGNTVEAQYNDPQPEVKIQYLEKNGGAVWMADPIGTADISGGTIENCIAYRGGAVYMEGGTFTLSDQGTIQNNTALWKDANTTQGFGGAVYVTGGTACVKGGSIKTNKAQVRGGGLYVSGGDVTVSGGSIQGNTAGFGDNLSTNVGRGGGVYLEGGLFTMTGGEISGNHANYRGGGIFVTKKPTLTKGTISGNEANDSGGGICVNGDAVELTSADMQIFDNTATNGGGVAVLNGEFLLNGGAVGVENGKPNIATENGGGVYVANDTATGTGSGTANVTVESGNIWYNEAKNGGGVYLESGNFSMLGETTESAFIRHNTATENGGGVYLKAGSFTMNDKTAFISHNSAKNGGGIYLYTNPVLLQGTIEQNTATENGGGMFISDCKVGLNPTADVTITGNHAQNGAGIYIHDSTGGTTPADGSVDAVTSSTIPNVGLRVGKAGVPFEGRLIFTDNIATQSGGAVCVDAGQFNLESGNITMTGNRAVNGGGVAVLKGNFTMLTGSIGESDGANHATNGGGVYVSDGEIWLKGGRIQYNQATDGGGAYVTGGRMVMTNGSLNNNTAVNNGGGAYAAGNFRMLGGIVGGDGGKNQAKNGGGVYVNEGNVYVIYGEISHNYASNDGGGFHVSAADQTVQVLMLSGSLSYNRADQNGGGMAVESSNNNQSISVEIGCLLDHYNAQGTIELPIDYKSTKVGEEVIGRHYEEYATFDGKDYHHDSCPEVKENNAGSIGGGFYLNSDSSTVSFFCVKETGNKAQGKDSAGMDVVGGTVIIGDEKYHNHRHDTQTDKGGYNWGRPRGHVSMENAALVNGGQVDIYGDMTNPIFEDEVTVSIQSKEDHFKDHRRSKNSTSYKVHYFENFNDTGLYQARQYNEGETKITIAAAYYSHPGYQILGWCTKPVRNEGEEGNYYYPVGKEIDLADINTVLGLGQSDAECDKCGGNKDDNLLVLYAIWKAYGYTVVFDPNVQPGDTYTGTMDKQIFNYDEKKARLKNEYKYPGYLFTGWSMSADGSTGTLYADEAEVTNLTNQNGVEITLYAQWKLCDHKDPHRWTYEVSEDGKTLLRICSCGRQTLHATLYAEDTVYDGLSHPATMTLDDPEAWGTDAPTIVYTGERLKPEDETYGTLEFDEHGIPYHASEYTASITKYNGKTPVTASVQYTIAKADQKAPGTPTYEIAENKEEVKINKLASNQITDEANKPHTAEVEYRLSHYVDSTLEYTTWGKITAGADKYTIGMPTALTNYNVEVRYEELEDYNPSEITRADDVFFYEGDITVIVKCDKGINYDMVFAKKTDTTSNGITLTLNLKTGYYLVGGDYTVTKTLKREGDTVPSDPVAVSKKGEESNIYSITDILNESTLTITIGTTRKSPNATAKVTPGQKFSTFAGVATTISRDSAFTAAFEIGNFDPCYTREGKSYGVYSDLKLTFGSKIPEGTTIILLDRGQNGEKTYWYYRANGEVASVLLTEFKKMGGSGSYTVPEPAEVDGYVDLNYQFIVDFSQSVGGYSEESLTMHLTAERKDATVPEINPQVTVSMADSSFTFAKADETTGLTHSFDCGFSITKNGTAVTENGIAYKWENRASALILTPAAGTALPSDASIVAVIGNSTTVLYKSGDSFIIPMSLLQTGTRQVQLTLQSALFPEKEAASYHFTAKWWISPSKAGKAPKVEDPKGGPLDVTFTSSVKTVPSLKIQDGSRVLTKTETLKLNIDTRNLDTGYTIEAALLRKAADGTYIETGWNDETVTKDQGLSVPLNACEPGSYCLKVTVKKRNSVTIVLEVPYYFVIKQTQ